MKRLIDLPFAAVLLLLLALLVAPKAEQGPAGWDPADAPAGPAAGSPVGEGSRPAAAGTAAGPPAVPAAAAEEEIRQIAGLFGWEPPLRGRSVPPLPPRRSRGSFPPRRTG